MKKILVSMGILAVLAAWFQSFVFGVQVGWKLNMLSRPTAPRPQPYNTRVRYQYPNWAPGQCTRMRYVDGHQEMCVLERHVTGDHVFQRIS